MPRCPVPPTRSHPRACGWDAGATVADGQGELLIHRDFLAETDAQFLVAVAEPRHLDVGAGGALRGDLLHAQVVAQIQGERGQRMVVHHVQRRSPHEQIRRHPVGEIKLVVPDVESEVEVDTGVGITGTANWVDRIRLVVIAR